MQAKKLILGCGYLGSRVAARWLASGSRVCAVTRTQERADDLQGAGLSPIVADLATPGSLQNLPAAQTVLYAAGYDPRSGGSRRGLHVIGLKRWLDRLSGSVERLIFISTIGVYGDTNGNWVDEESPCTPIGESGTVYLEAEQALMAHALGRRAIILRLAGLYGPGRVPRRVSLLAGEPIPAAQGFLNLIHVDDAVQVVLDAERLAIPPRLYCVSDGHPVPRGDYYAELARHWNAPPPVFATHSGTPRSGRGISNKRVSNERMLHELRTILQFPDYRQGLAAIVSNSIG